MGNKATNKPISATDSTVVSEKGRLNQVAEGAYQFGDKSTVNASTNYTASTGGTLTINDNTAFADFAGKVTDAFSGALAGSQSLSRDALAQVGDVASGGEQSTKKTLLWLALAGLGLWLISKKL